MKKRTGYCLRQDEHSLVGVSVVEAGAGWRVEELAHTTPDGALPADLLAAMGKATTPVTWLMADDEASVSHLNLPRLRGKALARAFVGGLARDEGGRPEDWCVAWQQLTQTGRRQDQDRQPYILHYASRQIVNRHLDTAGRWGVDPQRMLPGHLALDLFYRAHGPERDDHKVWNLVFVGQKQHFLCVATRDSQLMIRNLPANLSAGEDGQEYLVRLAAEIDRSVFFARQTENSPEVERIIVCGDPALAAPLVDVLATSSAIPALHWPLENMFQWGLNEVIPDHFLALAGAALSLQKIPFNFLPERSRYHISRGFRRKLAVAATTCAATVVPVLLIGGMVTARVQETYMQRAQARLHVAQAKARQAERAYDAQCVLLSREEHIRNYAHTRPDFESVLLRLAALTPEEVVFRSLQIREQEVGRFRLQLHGESRAATGERAQDAFLGLLAALDRSDFLQRVGEPRVMQIKPGQDEGADSKTTIFRLELEWRGPTQGGK